MTFAERIKEYRVKNQMTLEQLSKITGLAKQTLNRYELGTRVPKVDIVDEIAKKLNINTLWLMGYDVDMAGYQAHNLDTESKATDSIEDMLKQIKNNDNLQGVIMCFDGDKQESVELSKDEYKMLKDILKAIRGNESNT